MPPNPENPSAEIIKQDESIFTLHEKAAFAEFLRHFGKEVKAEDMTDGYIIEECLNIADPVNNPPFDNQLGQILTQLVEKAKKAKQDMQENVTLLACKGLPAAEPGQEREHVTQYLFRYVQEKEKYPFSIRVQMAILTLDTLIRQDEAVKEPDTRYKEGCENVILMESFIAALNYWSNAVGLGGHFRNISESEEARKDFIAAVQNTRVEHLITGSIETMVLNNFIDSLREALIIRGIIVKKAEKEIQNDTKLEIAAATKNKDKA